MREVCFYEIKELTVRIMCAGSLTLLMVCCEQKFIIAPMEDGVMIHSRQTRLWRGKWDKIKESLTINHR